MNAEVHEPQKPLAHNALFEVHMLLLRWGRARLARKKQTTAGDPGCDALTPAAECTLPFEGSTATLSPEIAEVANTTA